MQGHLYSRLPQYSPDGRPRAAVLGGGGTVISTAFISQRSQQPPPVAVGGREARAAENFKVYPSSIITELIEWHGRYVPTSWQGRSYANSHAPRHRDLIMPLKCQCLAFLRLGKYDNTDSML